MERNKFYVDGIKDYYYTVSRNNGVIYYKVFNKDTGETIVDEKISAINVFKVWFFYQDGLSKAEKGIEFLYQRAHKVAKMAIQSAVKYT